MSVQFAFLFPRFKILSGAERLILKLAGALVEKGHEVHILSHQFDSSCSPLLRQGVQLHVSGVPLDYFPNRYANAAFDYFRSSKLLNQLPATPDAVCCFGPALTAIPLLRKRTKAPLLYFCYEPPRFLYTDRDVIGKRVGLPAFATGPLFGIYRRKDQRLVESVDAVLSNSEFGRRQIRAVYGREASVITHGLDPFMAGTLRSEIRRENGWKDSNVVVLTVNYLHPRKRIDLFIEAVKLAHTQNPSIRGWIVGDGPERKLLEGLSGDAISFAGFIPEQDLYQYYQAADVYLHTARMETFGLSVIEASGNRLPVVSVNEGGPQETILDSKTGFLRETGAENLASSLLALSVDVEIRKAMGMRGYEYVREKYSWSRGADDFLEAVETVRH